MARVVVMGAGLGGVACACEMKEKLGKARMAEKIDAAQRHAGERGQAGAPREGRPRVLVVEAGAAA